MIDNTMTIARRRRKRPPRGRVAAGLAVLMVVGALGLTGPLRAATTEWIVTDRNTGLAISGFDAVAYFTEGDATLGKGDFEYTFAGAVWRFHNEGNRSAFQADPEVYMPRFGGYDPVDVARGVAVPGDPRLWAVAGARLYLFYTPQALDSFLQDTDRIAATADRNWPSVQLQLAP